MALLSVQRRTLTYMDKRYEIRCDGADLVRWREAAGRVPLAVWIRDALNAAAGSSPVVDSVAGPPVPVVVKRGWDDAVALNPPLTPGTHTGVVGRSFRPDPRVKKR